MQEDLVHFGYLLERNGGFLRTARDVPEHLGLLAQDLASNAGYREGNERFVTSFVRPYGIDVPAMPRLVEEIERLGRDPVRKRRPPLAPRVAVLRSVLRLESAAAERRKRLTRAVVQRGQVLLRRGVAKPAPPATSPTPPVSAPA